MRAQGLWLRTSCVVSSSVSFVACLAMFVTACAPIAGPVTVEALTDDPAAPNGVRLTDVVLTSVTDLARGKGSLFDVFGGLRMAGLTVSASVEAKDDAKTMIARCRGDGGDVFEPRMHFDGTRWQAEDLETLTAFSAFHALEQAFATAHDAGDRKGSAPGAVVGITSEIVAANLFPVPLLTSDNAAYAPPLDGWLTLTTTVQQGVPFAMSLPVLAHEFGHRLFFRNVFARDEALDVWRSRLNAKLSADRKRSNRLMQGIDEGLADVVSIAVTQDAHGIARAFTQAQGPYQAEAARRDLEGPYAEAATYDNLDGLTLDSTFLNACGASDNKTALFEQDTFNFYCLGTVLARTLWDSSGHDASVLRDAVLPAIIRAYPKLGDTLADNPAFDVEFFLNPFLAELDPSLLPAACASTTQHFASLVQAQRVPACL